jgi:hypothetical protein
MTVLRWKRIWTGAIAGAKQLEVLVKGVGPVIAVLWIGWQYNESRMDKRVENTLAYVTRFESGETSIGKAQRAITEALWRHNEEIAEFRTTRGSEPQLREIRLTIIRRILASVNDKLGSTSVMGPMEEIDNFFDALATCVQGAVCDDTSARRYFGCAVVGYLESFEPMLEERARVAPNYGWGLRWLAEKIPKHNQCWR